LWLAAAGSWSASASVLAEKLPQAALLGPAMLAAGALVGADAAARRAFCSAALAIGVAVGGGVAWGVATDFGGAGRGRPARTPAGAGAVPDSRPVHSLRRRPRGGGGVEARGAGGAAAPGRRSRRRWRPPRWCPGGRAALLGLGLAVAGAPALRLWLAGGRGAALLWLGATGAAGLGGLALLAHGAPVLSDELRTVERVFGDPAAATPARLVIWGEALRWAGLAAPFGLGTGGFTVAAGLRRRARAAPAQPRAGALAEGGLPGSRCGCWPSAAARRWRWRARGGWRRGARRGSPRSPCRWR
jgi:hypothetical protein